MKRISRAVLCALCLAAIIHPLPAQWIPTTGPIPANVVVEKILTGENKMFAAFAAKGLYRTADDGKTWTAANAGLPQSEVTGLVAAGGRLFAALYSNGVFLSSDGGGAWSAINTGLTNTIVTSLVVSGTTLYAGTYGGIFRSTKSGSTWETINTGLTDLLVYSLAVNGAMLFAGTRSGLFRSADGGETWTYVNIGVENPGIDNLTVSGSDVYASVHGKGVYRSSDNGQYWTATGLTTTILSMVAEGARLFAGTISGVFMSADSGSSWTNVSTGLKDITVNMLTVKGDDLLAGTLKGGMWRRPLAEMAASGKSQPTGIPQRITLEQNFPNPFNPSTTIAFTLSFNAHVSLKIFDVTGREVATILNQEMAAGSYSREWNASDLPSGAYFCRLQAGVDTETKRMILVK